MEVGISITPEEVLMAESPKRGRPTAHEAGEKNEPHDKAEIIEPRDASGATQAGSRSSEFMAEAVIERTTPSAGSTEFPSSDSSSGAAAEGHEASGPCVTFFDAASPAKALSLTGVT